MAPCQVFWGTCSSWITGLLAKLNPCQRIVIPERDSVPRCPRGISGPNPWLTLPAVPAFALMHWCSEHETYQQVSDNNDLTLGVAAKSKISTILELHKAQRMQAEPNRMNTVLVIDFLTMGLCKPSTMWAAKTYIQ